MTKEELVADWTKQVAEQRAAIDVFQATNEAFVDDEIYSLSYATLLEVMVDKQAQLIAVLLK